MDLALIGIITAAVLGVVIVVLAVIAVVVLAPAVRRAMAERAASIPQQASPDPHSAASETDTRDDEAGRP